MDRRQFLASATLSLAGVTAGCSVLSSGPDLSGYVRPEEDPTQVPERHQCDKESISPFDTIDRPNWGETDNVALRVDELAFDYGETATITLTNTSGGELSTGTKEMHLFDIYTETGWQAVQHCVGDCPGVETIGIFHKAGDGFEWNITLTRTGVSNLRESEKVVACPDLVSARYRFVFHGADTPVAVAFDLQRES
jgi:hypothetical protein